MIAGEVIHHIPQAATMVAVCGVDVFRTPYTYGSPKLDEVTCEKCLAPDNQGEK